MLQLWSHTRTLNAPSCIITFRSMTSQSAATPDGAGRNKRRWILLSKGFIVARTFECMFQPQTHPHHNSLLNIESMKIKLLLFALYCINTTALVIFRMGLLSLQGCQQSRPWRDSHAFTINLTLSRTRKKCHAKIKNPPVHFLREQTNSCIICLPTT